MTEILVTQGLETNNPIQRNQFLWNAYQRGDRSCSDVDSWQPETMWHLPLAQVQAQFETDH